ncbi:MAG: LCP family protein [Negativicutes bacterium]|nr:LCP family protein [Negativicutes bacterium]
MINRWFFWNKALVSLLGLFVVVVALAGAVAWLSINPAPSRAANHADAAPPPAPEQAPGGIEKRINILLLGLDDGDFDHPDNPRRSDTMIVASIDPGAKTVNLLSIPRDSRVIIPGQPGHDKIAHAFFYGGPELAVHTVESFLNIPVDYYVVIDWQAFMEAVDILGGVNIDVEHAMNYDDPYENLSIHLPKGYQHLDGQKAGEYVRFRHDELGDIGRVQRQELFLHALESQLMQTGTLLKLPALATTLYRYVHTNMNIYTMIRLAGTLKDVGPDHLHTAMIPGDFATIDDLSYWQPDMANTRKVVDSMLKPAQAVPQYGYAEKP